ncbi:DUF924 domain-containing protein [Rhizobium sp. KVB221]|uniref:DUF924 domain-containing protein n=1 Tax=Rhizobium setariae TaxID=2801340 RepID=A0A937CP40_9HYPH|nr:DUF924 family protein [Rhizobium setariae]MBL0371377.1 DUF924 domain-containing protein [Rhizobium setariae]
MNDEIKAVLDFWFAPERQAFWFERSDAFDEEIRQRFAALYERAKAGELNQWAQTSDGALALTIVLDQFPRNMFRNSPRAFESDQQARTLCRTILAEGLDQGRSVTERQFMYLPLMHSEALRDQKDSVDQYRALGDANTLDFAVRHHDIVARFGCFPHRNEVVGRHTTDEEAEFLKTNPGF